MAGKWKSLTLRQAGVSLIDCDHRTPPAAATGYPYIAIPQLKQGRLELSEVRCISREHFVEWTRKASPRVNDVILSRRCNPGETAYVPKGFEGALGQNLVLLRADRTRLHPPFLRWLVRSPLWWEQIGKFLNVGAVFDSLRCADVPNFELPVPPLCEQEGIAHILGALDDKIELNRRMNATLEATARGLFQSWFVDFDPVRAKLDRRAPAMLDPATAALFPAEFQRSPLGPIPRGWVAGCVDDVATNVRRGIQPTEIAPGTPYIALEHMPRRCIALGDWEDSASVSSGKFSFQKGEILFGKLRPYFHKVGVAPLDGICSTDILVLSPKTREWFGFLLGHVSSDSLISFTDVASTGTKMPRTSWEYVRSFGIALPPKSLAAAFTLAVKPMIDRVIANIYESRKLAAVRDALLPKLLSGELRVERLAETVEAMR